MAAPASQDIILGRAVREVLQGYSDAADIGAYEPIYEQHFEQVPKLEGGAVQVETARQHFSSMLQGDAFDAILGRVQHGTVVADQLSKEQFLTITHLVSCTLAAAQNSDALWVDPEEPSSTHKKRHPTVQECLGSRLAAAEGGRCSSSLSHASDASQRTPPGAKLPRAYSSSKENVGSAANTSIEDRYLGRPGSRKQASPSRRPVLALEASETGGIESIRAVDVSEFERKLQALMRRMQQDQAKLEGKPAAKEDIVALPITVDEGVQASDAGAASTRPSTRREWESFGASPDDDAAARPTANPFAAPPGVSSLQQEVPQGSPFSELNPLRRAQQGAAWDGSASRCMAVGYPVATAGFASPVSSLAGETPLHPTPVPGMSSSSVACSTPPQPQCVNQLTGTLDSQALAVAMQQLSVQQALAAQLGPAATVQNPYLQPADPAAVAAVARAQVQLEAAAAQLVAAATARPHYSPSNSSASTEHGGGAACGGSLTARDHHGQANSPRQGRSLGASEHRPQPRPSRLSQQSPSGGAAAGASAIPESGPMTARAAAQSRVVELSSWQPMPAEDMDRCKKMFVAKGYQALGGMGKGDAQQLFARLQMAAHLFAPVWAAADGDKDGMLSMQEFCLFMYILRMVQKGFQVPTSLTREQVARLLGLEQHIPAGTQQQQQQQAMKVDLGKIKSALRPVSRLQEAAVGHGLEEQGASSDSEDSGFDDSMSLASRSSSRLAPVQQQLRVPSQAPWPPAQAASSQRHDHPIDAVHARLAIHIRGAEVHYSKPLEKPFFNISVHDSLVRTVEIPQDTPPGHYAKEAHRITLNHMVQLQTSLSQIPRGSTVCIEIKHFKPREGRMSTLGWTYLTLEKVLDWGPVMSRVREGPLTLPLYRKPVDLSLRRLKRVGRRDEIQLTIAGVA